MRISDWSSDVCSSDLLQAGDPCRKARFRVIQPGMGRHRPHQVGDMEPKRGSGRIEHRQFGRRFNRSILDVAPRSEEHTSELQSLMRISYAVFCLKKKTELTPQTITINYNKRSRNTHKH